tara:strand:- start:870 stop:1481 length:612 start_codon:yes stop_codon:yes gene_type:complete
MIINSIIILVLNCIILRYVYELEKKSCKCSLDGQHKFIKYFAPVIILVSLIGLFVSEKSFIKTVIANKFLGVVLSIYCVVSLVYSINLILYFLKLVYSKCECSKDWKRYGMLYPALVMAVILLIVLVFSIAMLMGQLPKLLFALRPKGTRGINSMTTSSGINIGKNKSSVGTLYRVNTNNSKVAKNLRSVVEKANKAKVSKRK